MFVMARVWAVACTWRHGLTHEDAQLLQLAVDPRSTPERICGAEFADQAQHVPRHFRTPGAVCRLFHVHHRRKPRRCQPFTVSGSPRTGPSANWATHRHHPHSIRSAGVRRSRCGRERWMTVN